VRWVHCPLPPHSTSPFIPDQRVPAADQVIIREIVDMERQSKEATLHRDADFTSGRWPTITLPLLP